MGDEHSYKNSDELIKDLYIKAAGGGEQGEQKYEDLMDRFDVWPVTLQQIQAKNQELMSEIEKAYVVLPVYLLDHSGLSVSTHSFNDPWDSGQTGRTAATQTERQSGNGSQTAESETGPFRMTLTFGGTVAIE
ncbi:MAG: hypothetical protein II025_02230, partial [Ruminococcus sp.]|nr:hypothetical protein [Ruminococcus sp.]